MDRVAGKAAIALATILLLWGTAAHSAGSDAAGRPGGAPASEKEAGYRLEEIRIVGSAERPAVRILLPRIAFRLLPMREPDLDVKSRLLIDDKSLRAPE